MTGKEAGTGASTSWLAYGVDRRVCDAALWVCVEHWRDVELFKRAEQVIELGWHAGSRHPDLADAYAGQLAAAGWLANLDRALEVCDDARDGGRFQPTGVGTPTVASQPAGRTTAASARPTVGEAEAETVPTGSGTVLEPVDNALMPLLGRERNYATQSAVLGPKDRSLTLCPRGTGPHVRLPSGSPDWRRLWAPGLR